MGSHVTAPPPAGSLAIKVEAGNAFGTGRHESTRGCLLALDRLAKRRRVRRALDMGCGSGVLAIAVAKLWRDSLQGPVLALDNDPIAVAVTKENAAVNAVATVLEAAVSDGYRGLPALGGGPFDLIVANILAEPLEAMAGDLAAHLAPGGTAILSGLLAVQERSLRAKHRTQGIILKDRVRLGGWTTLILGR